MFRELQALCKRFAVLYLHGETPYFVLFQVLEIWFAVPETVKNSVQTYATWVYYSSCLRICIFFIQYWA